MINKNHILFGASLMLSAFLLMGKPVLAAPEYNVTPMSATFYTTANAEFYLTPDNTGVPAAVTPAGLPVMVTGVTDNYFFVVNVNGTTFYMPSTALSSENASAPAAEAVPVVSYSSLIAIPTRNAAATTGADACAIADQAIQDRVQNLSLAVPPSQCETVYQTLYQHLSELSNVQIASYNVADIRSMEVGYSTGEGGKVYVNLVYGSAGHDAEVEAVIQSKYAEFASLPTAYDKVKAVHDYLCEHITYVQDDYYSHTAYGALAGGTAVCDGYSLAFQRFMDVLGIPCLIATGERNGDSHAWNLVQLDGQWYHLDVTWDDQTWGIIRDYFLISGKNAGYQNWGGIQLAGRNYR